MQILCMICLNMDNSMMKIKFHTNIFLLSILVFYSQYNSLCSENDDNSTLYKKSEYFNNDQFCNNIDDNKSAISPTQVTNSTTLEKQITDLGIWDKCSFHLIKMFFCFMDFLGFTYREQYPDFKFRTMALKHIFIHSFFRGIGSTKRCDILNKHTWQSLYFGIGNVPYIGGGFIFSLIWKPSWLKYLHNTYLPSGVKEVTIRIIGFRIFAMLLLKLLQNMFETYRQHLTPITKDNYFLRSQMLSQLSRKYYMEPYFFDFLTIDFKVLEYYNISLNIGSLIISYWFYKQLQEGNYFEYNNDINHIKKYQDNHITNCQDEE